MFLAETPSVRDFDWQISGRDPLTIPHSSQTVDSLPTPYGTDRRISQAGGRPVREILLGLDEKAVA